MKNNNDNEKNTLRLIEKLLTYRKKNGLSAMQMAVKLDLSWVTYLNAEKGMMSDKTRWKIETFFEKIKIENEIQKIVGINN